MSRSQLSVDGKVFASLKKMFGDSTSITLITVKLTSEEKQQLFDRSRSRWTGDTITVYRCIIGKEVVGYGFIDNVKGKTQLITYLVGVRPTGNVQDIDVLAYRESYGGEIAYESFRKQFRQKTTLDKLQPGRDIKNISGATISVHAITDGVRKILTTFELTHDRIP
ncbi:MAG: FMN-binding protein [Ignavibacteria bacterium]|nr:FMN-binding protein [Ignavibacteria bacterium]MBI3766606.1 FMN-binding protein [Ignavibacteriales bacterium]